MKKVWFGFYMSYRDVNIEKDLSPSSKKGGPLQNLNYLFYQIQNFTFDNR